MYFTTLLRSGNVLNRRTFCFGYISTLYVIYLLVGIDVSLEDIIHQEVELTGNINNFTNGSLSYNDKSNNRNASYFQRSLPGHNPLIPAIEKRLGNWSIFLKDAWKYKNKTLVASLPREMDKTAFSISSTTITLKRQIKECIYAHNYLRQLHGLSLLRWNGDLAYAAEEWAMQLAERDYGLMHSQVPTDSGLYFGENGYLGSMKNCSDAVWQWYSEIDDFNFDDPAETWGSSTGHFVQVLYPATAFLGVGVAYTREESTYVVAQYMSGVSTEPTHIPPAESGQEAKREDLNLPGAKTKLFNFIVPLQGGWTNWEPMTICSVTCGEGIQKHKRFCIDTTSTSTADVDCGDGPKESFLNCSMPDCPAPEPGECNDMSGNCTTDGNQKNCMDIDHVEWMRANCKKTCNFCRPCRNLNPDCGAYSKAPYAYCTDERYRDWMLVNCAKACGYCEKNLTTVYDSHCMDYSYLCGSYSEKNYCMNDIYSDWMKIHCRQTCGFCKKCANHDSKCDLEATNGSSCTNEDSRDWMFKMCPKVCGYCFEPPLPPT